MHKVGTPLKRFDPTGKWDAIVVGSGIGGLSAAAMLARHGGKRVLVLERHYTAGGFTHVFQRRDYEWDVGVHYVGDVGSRRRPLRRLFDHLTEGRLEWASMGEVYDRVIIGQDSYDLVTGARRFSERLKAYFPGEAAAIDRYLSLIRRIEALAPFFFAEKLLPPFAASTLGTAMRLPYLYWLRRTTAEVLSSLTSHTRLQAVLAAQFGDYGVPPGRSAFGLHATLARHFLGGAYYPVGGASAIGASIEPVIASTGGAIVTSAEVVQILMEGDRAAGVRLAEGLELRAPMIISDAGVDITFRQLVPQAAAERARLPELAGRVEHSVGHVCAYVGLRHTAAELGLQKANLWLYPSEDYDGNIDRYLRDPDAELPLVFASFPSAKDPEFEQRHPGRSTLELVTLAPWTQFSAWKDGRWRRRGEDYDALKNRIGERMLERLSEVVPSVRGKVDLMEVSTPLSTRQFASYRHGELYGLSHAPARFEERFLRPRTPIPGLYLTGQDVITCGIASSMIAGVLTASVVLGRPDLFLQAMRGASGPAARPRAHRVEPPAPDAAAA